MYYPCFISFRHFGDEISEAFISQLEKCLTSELVPLIGVKPFIDYERLKPGYRLSKSLAEAICQSVCMLVIWTPQYFSKEHLWCATEFKAMEDLEKQRLALLPANEQNKRLIIPIIYRGAKYYPKSLEDTLYLNFEQFSLYNPEMIKNPSFIDKIKELAEYIKDRYDAFERIGVRPWGNCEEFELPPNKTVEAYMHELGVLEQQKFPFR